MAETVMKSVDVNVPIRTAYNQWTQFEEFPQFMEGIERVEQLDDTQLHWVANIGGEHEEWTAEITEQLPDERVAWRSRTGASNAGVVTFHRLDDNSTRVTLQMEYEPDSFKEKVGDMLGMAERRIEGDMQRFKNFIEGRGHETGGWRGTVDRPSD